MLPLRKKSGFVFIFVLFIFSFLLIYGIMFAARAAYEWKVADHQRRAAQAFYLAEAASETALDQLDAFVNTDLLTTVSGMNPQTVGKKSENAVGKKGGYSGIDFLIEMVNSSQEQFTLSDDETQALYSASSTSYGAGTYAYDIVVKEAGDVVVLATDMWEFPFKFHLKGTGTVNGLSREIVLEGNFTIMVQKDNFAKYALFSDHHTMKSGGTVWFTDGTNFAGPIHTNEQFCFAGDPSLSGLAGIFDGLVTQHLNKAKFYNNGWPITSDVDFNGTKDVPVFNAGYQRGNPEIVLASSVQKQDLYEQALGSQTPTGSGIIVANDSGALTGGIYVDGDATITMGVDASDHAQYTISQGGVTKVVTVDIDNNQTTVTDSSTGVSTTYSGMPDGQDDLGTIIYVNGAITSLGGGTDASGNPLPAVQKDTEVTISSENDVVITNNLLYSNYAPASGSPGDLNYTPPNAEGYDNLLGIISWGGDVRIGTSAPDDLNVHSVIMARNGVFTVDDYDDWGGGRGDVNLLGGVITQFYGAFGLFNGSTGQQISGYGRNFVYDSRMMQGKSPPYFPTMKTFIAFTNNLTDNIVFWEGSLP